MTSESESASSSSRYSKEPFLVTDPYTGAQRILTDYGSLTKAQTGVSDSLRSRLDTKSGKLQALPHELCGPIAVRTKSREKSGYRPTDLWCRAAGTERPKGSRIISLDWDPSDLWYHVRDQGEGADRLIAGKEEVHPTDSDDACMLIEEILASSSDLAKSGKPSRRQPRESKGVSPMNSLLSNPKRSYERRVGFGSGTENKTTQNLHEVLDRRKSNMKPLHKGRSSKMELGQRESWSKRSRAAEWCNRNLELDNRAYRGRLQYQSPKVSTVVSTELVTYQHEQDKERLRAERASQENLQSRNAAFRRHLQRVESKVVSSWS
eukprot:gnl/MRDRNA2_/MRDRNA2_111745_c0_seq1.p1 gnl/MRDRNA2_/MRDRNA2_111745_c0~~gnl/MRDRNA2_/MRDRNA2_111745_c0_seq1.p1  ORF type:complete len:346 (-),score=46.71 gnl/MRDRNA2_/MRDRNA2_111745_c0_seq1:119-1081(-)